MSTVNKFAKQKDLIEINDGVRQFSIYNTTCYDIGPEFTQDQQTHIKISDYRHDMNELSKSFLNFDFECTFQFSKNVTLAADTNDFKPRAQYFLGWKNSSDLLKTLQIINANIYTNYIQRECSRESFCLNCMKPNEVKLKNKFSHTLYEQARTGQIGVCGTYFVPENGKDITQEQTVKFSIVLPISDITCLQSFPDWPSILGDLELQFSINADSMVWCQCDPYELAISNGIKQNDITSDSNYKYLGYERRFAQVNSACRCILDYDTRTLGEQTLFVRNLVCKKCTCDIYGYNVSTDTKAKIYNLFNETVYIPAQQIDVVQLPKYNGTGSYNENITIQVHNVTSFCVVIPEQNNSVTCYRNSMLHDVQFLCNGIGFPHEPLRNTYDSLFYTSMMRAGDQSNYFEADNDYKNSVFSKRLTEHVNTLSDNTSFFIIFQTERNSNGYYYDGIDTNTTKVSCQLKFSNSDLIWPNDTKPQIWFVRDTYWTLDNKNGLKYVKSGTPEI